MGPRRAPRGPLPSGPASLSCSSLSLAESGLSLATRWARVNTSRKPPPSSCSPRPYRRPGQMTYVDRAPFRRARRMKRSHVDRALAAALPDRRVSSAAVKGSTAGGSGGRSDSSPAAGAGAADPGGRVWVPLSVAVGGIPEGVAETSPPAAVEAMPWIDALCGTRMPFSCSVVKQFDFINEGCNEECKESLGEVIAEPIW